jgi:hypothetical protein
LFPPPESLGEYEEKILVLNSSKITTSTSSIHPLTKTIDMLKLPNCKIWATKQLSVFAKLEGVLEDGEKRT